MLSSRRHHQSPTKEPKLNQRQSQAPWLNHRARALPSSKPLRRRSKSADAHLRRHPPPPELRQPKPCASSAGASRRHCQPPPSPHRRRTQSPCRSGRPAPALGLCGRALAAQLSLSLSVAMGLLVILVLPLVLLAVFRSATGPRRCTPPGRRPWGRSPIRTRRRHPPRPRPRPP